MHKDGYRTKTNHGLNKHYHNVFRPALLKAVDQQVKKYKVNDFVIECEQQNEVETDGYKVDSIKVVGIEYTIRVYMANEYEQTEGTCVALSVDFTTDKEEANKLFKQNVENCKY